jgi:hypothetical protein
MDNSMWIVLIAIGVLLLAWIYFLPTYIAFKRQHAFKWIILAINVVLGASGLGWLIALIWAIYPQEKSLADPVLGNPTGTGTRNVGHTLADLGAAQSQGQPGDATAALDALERLDALAKKGVITEEEFKKKKADLLRHV